MSEILLIDAEQPFAADLVGALKGQGFAVKQLDDGKEGLEYARDHKPALIVLCVELPKMSGYSICNKLKKDGDLKDIPLIITSKEATPETFAQHKKLKTRAEDYLIKPFEHDALVEKIGGLIPLPAGNGAGAAAAIDDDEAISLDADLDSLDIDAASEGLPELEGDDALLAGLEDPGPSASVDGDLGDVDDVLASLDNDDEPLPDLSGASADEALAGLGDIGADDIQLGKSVQVDDDLESFDALGGLDDAPAARPAAPPPAHPPPTQPPPMARAAPAPAPAPAATPAPAPAAAPASSSTSADDMAALMQARREATDLKAKVAELESKLRAAEDEAKHAREAMSASSSSSSSSAREVLNLKEQVRSRDKELDKLKDEIFEHEKKGVELQEQLDQVKGEIQAAQTRITSKDAEIARLNTQVSSLAQERDDLEREVAERLSALTGERDRTKAELDAAQAAAEHDRGRLQAELEDKNHALRMATDANRAIESKVRHLEDQTKKSEEQLMKAYQQLKAEEALRGKAKQAAQVAIKILSGDVEKSSADVDLDLDQLEA